MKTFHVGELYGQIDSLLEVGEGEFDREFFCLNGSFGELFAVLKF